MNTNKITSAEIAPLKVASLPSRPTAPTSFGGRGYTAIQMKEAFDKLPLFIIDRLNSLIDDITSGGVADELLTRLKDGHTLTNLFSDITSGELAGYLKVLGMTLNDAILDLRLKWSQSVAGNTENEEEIASLLDEVSSISQRCTELAELISATETRVMARVEVLEDADENKNSSIEALIGRISTCEGRLAINDATHNDLESRLASCENRCSVLKTTTENTDTRVSEIEERLQTIDVDLADVKAHVDLSTDIIEMRDEPYVTIDLESKEEYRLGVVEELNINIGEEVPEDFFAIVSFDVEEVLPMVSIDVWVQLTGDGVDYDMIYTQEYYHYTMVFWYDGVLQCAVRKVTNE